MTFRNVLVLLALLLVVAAFQLGLVDPAHAGGIGLAAAAGITYDDGSTLTVFDDGSTLATSAPDGSGTMYVSSTDAAESNKFSQFYPDSSKPWYEQLAMLGATRAIDSHFAATETNKSVQPITAAGQNGQTYAAGNTAPKTIAGIPVGWVLMGVAAVAVLAIASGK